MTDTSPSIGTAGDGTTVHATCIVVGEAGVLIRGEAGAGKTSLALALIDCVTGTGRFAALVGDDRIRLERHDGRLVARPHPAVAGLAEIRGFGIAATDWLPAAVLRLVVDLVAAAPR
ncbi:HPr kinase/phosphorylase, partial [Methylobacterium trifolii]